MEQHGTYLRKPSCLLISLLCEITPVSQAINARNGPTQAKMECVFLLNSKDWVRGVMKGDSILLLSRFHGNNERRFRVEFDRFADKTGVEQCQLCTDLLSQYFPFHERSEIAATRNTGINSTDFFKQQFESPEVLREIVKSCLQDPSFPNFVKQVDDTLQSLLSKP
ncbi:uncharacterized protein [Dermacentor andersoni]|uniref:uncharacterized protein isoform X2 n=1 Tax=Dermacentor andersoni TaxID=34620 RepID=UPI0024180DB9|nr:uncharacterized protein LOC126536488 isoform X2 [Dermacentor andersoni]